MSRSERAEDDGSAALEFITAGMLLLIPLVYLVLAMAQVQGGALAVEGASRQAARVFVQSPSVATGDAQAHAAVDIALDDFGIKHKLAAVTISCRPVASRCLTRRGFVTVRVVAFVSLPLVPSVLSSNEPFQIPMSATSTEQVSRFWGAAG